MILLYIYLAIGLLASIVSIIRDIRACDVDDDKRVYVAIVLCVTPYWFLILIGSIPELLRELDSWKLKRSERRIERLNKKINDSYKGTMFEKKY